MLSLICVEKTQKISQKYYRIQNDRGFGEIKQKCKFLPIAS
jgi:hypothetical protein